MSADQGGNRLVDYLGHMLDAIELVRWYTDVMKKQNFIEEMNTQITSVVMNQPARISMGALVKHRPRIQGFSFI